MTSETERDINHERNFSSSVRKPYNLKTMGCQRWFEENFYEAIDMCEEAGIHPITEDDVDEMCMRQYDFHQWYFEIEPYTFKSEILNMGDIKYYNNPKFMRTEKASPKDVICSLGLSDKFLSTEDFMNICKKSKRCSGSKFIIVRDYVDIDESLEFRCFYFDGALRAISQYNEINLILSGRISPDDKDIIKERITKFIKMIDIPYRNAVIDISYDSCNYQSHDIHHGDIKIIELNYFGGHLPVGSCLYDWVQDKDILYSKNYCRNFDVDIRFYEGLITI